MRDLTPINRKLGAVLTIGFIVAQLLIILLLDPRVNLIALLTAGIFLPFFIIAYFSTLDRTKYPRSIKIGLSIGIGLFVIIPIFFPLFFDQEFIYISFIGIAFGILTVFLRKKIEVLFLIFNSISAFMLILIGLAAVLSE